MRTVSLHPDVVLATSDVWQTNCTIVRGPGVEPVQARGSRHEAAPAQEDEHEVVPAQEDEHEASADNESGKELDAHPRAESFVIDSPILPAELDVLPALLEQAGFPPPSGLLATHGDWDHLLGRIAFPATTLGCAESTVARMRSAPGEPQRELREFDEEHYIERERPLVLGSLQALPVPGRCGIGSRELELHAIGGHTEDGMAVWIPWARVLVAGDHLSSIEIPVISEGGALAAYVATLERLRPLAQLAEHVVPGHGPVLSGERASAILEDDLVYLRALGENAAGAKLPTGRRTSAQRAIHLQNIVRTGG
jgi:glyoxylase-like metal-dependent hydrolase (beta-lactamase superfamily II)